MPLALLLIVFSVRLVTIPTWDQQILLRYPWVYPMTAPLPFLFGPLVWWYIRELVSDNLNIPRYIYIHFLPYFFEFLAVTVTVMSMSSMEYKEFLQNVFSGNPPLWLPFRNGLKVLVNIIYIVFSARLAFGKKSLRLSVTKRMCARALVVLPSVVLAAFAYVALIPSVTKHLAAGLIIPFFILSVTMAVLIYGISFMLLIAPDISRFGISRKEGEQLCSEEECSLLLSLVEKRFEEGVYLNPDIMLTDLASELEVHPNRISFVINHCCGTSFRTFLNNRRLDYFSARVKNGALEKQSILDLAFEAGFPSKTTFNRFFREKTGMSPSEYAGNLFSE